MSTNYYRLKKPITFLKIESIITKNNLNHNELAIWINRDYAGNLVVPVSNLYDILQCFVDFDNEPVLRTHWGGIDKGSIVTIKNNTLDDKEIVVSDYCNILTVKQVKDRNGAKRKNGLPTELFGYED